VAIEGRCVGSVMERGESEGEEGGEMILTTLNLVWKEFPEADSLLLILG